MDNSEENAREKVVFQNGLFDNLTVQDAFTIIAIYGARTDPQDYQAKAAKIGALLNEHSIFDEKSYDTLTRINKFANAMEPVNSSDAVEKAAAVLSTKLRQEAFILASTISRTVLGSPVEAVQILNNLASKLSIVSEIADETIHTIIREFINTMDAKEIFALAHASDEEQIMMTRWAQDIYDRYDAVLKKHPSKIKDIDILPASKQEVKMALKILLTAYVLKKADKMVDSLKSSYISIGTFQKIAREDKKKILPEAGNVETLGSEHDSVSPEHHKYMEVIILEQNVLLDDVNDFINDLQKIKKES